MSHVEVKLPSPTLGPARGTAGKFSGIDDAFRRGAVAALRKYALYDNEQNAADTLAKLFRTTNFGYGTDGKIPEPQARKMSQTEELRWGRGEQGIDRAGADPRMGSLRLL